MSLITEPVDRLVEFARAEYKEPARVGLATRHTTTSQNFSGNGVLTTFTVTSTRLLCVNSVTLGGTAQTKYVHYNIDLRNNQIIFITAPPVGVDNIVVNYDFNTNGISWIFPDKAITGSLILTDYPRVGILQITDSSEQLGIGNDFAVSNASFQIDVATKQGLRCSNYRRVRSNGSVETVSEEVQGEQLTQILSRNLWLALKRNWRTEWAGSYWLPARPLRENKRIAFDESAGIFRRILDVDVQGFNMGEIQV